MSDKFENPGPTYQCPKTGFYSQKPMSAGPEICGVISGAKARLGKVDVRSMSATWDKAN
jgi:hypothetical protein